jgi:hypothetical protein
MNTEVLNQTDRGSAEGRKRCGEENRERKAVPACLYSAFPPFRASAIQIGIRVSAFLVSG